MSEALMDMWVVPQDLEAALEDVRKSRKNPLSNLTVSEEVVFALGLCQALHLPAIREDAAVHSPHQQLAGCRLTQITTQQGCDCLPACEALS